MNAKLVRQVLVKGKWFISDAVNLENMGLLSQNPFSYLSADKSYYRKGERKQNKDVRERGSVLADPDMDI